MGSKNLKILRMLFMEDPPPHSLKWFADRGTSKCCTTLLPSECQTPAALQPLKVQNTLRAPPPLPSPSFSLSPLSASRNRKTIWSCAELRQIF